MSNPFGIATTSLKNIQTGSIATITADQSLTLNAGKNITLDGASLSSGSNLLSDAAKESAFALANGKIDDVGIKIELNVGSSKSKSSSEYSSNTVSGISLSGAVASLLSPPARTAPATI